MRILNKCLVWQLLLTLHPERSVISCHICTESCLDVISWNIIFLLTLTSSNKFDRLTPVVWFLSLVIPVCGWFYQSYCQCIQPCHASLVDNLPQVKLKTENMFECGNRILQCVCTQLPYTGQVSFICKHLDWLYFRFWIFSVFRCDIKSTYLH